MFAVPHLATDVLTLSHIVGMLDRSDNLFDHAQVLGATLVNVIGGRLEI